MDQSVHLAGQKKGHAADFCQSIKKKKEKGDKKEHMLFRVSGFCRDR